MTALPAGAVECFVEDRTWSVAGVVVVVVAAIGLLTLGNVASAGMLFVGVGVALGRTRSRLDPVRRMHEVHWGVIVPGLNTFLPVHRRSRQALGTAMEVRVVPGARDQTVLLVHKLSNQEEQELVVGELPDSPTAHHLAAAVRAALGLVPSGSPGLAS